MARRYNLNFAGQNFGFDLPTVTDAQGNVQTESVLADYFPELKLTYAPKGSRGGRLGSSSNQTTTDFAIRQREAASAGATGGVPPNTAAPTTPTTPAAPVAPVAPAAAKAPAFNYGTFSLDEYNKALEPYNAQSRISEARRSLGLGDADAPYLGLLAASNVDEDVSKFSESEKNYALSLAKAAKAGGDSAFSPADLGKVESTLGAFQKLNPREFFKPGETELRTGSFLARTNLGGYSYQDFLSGKAAPAVTSREQYKAPAAAQTTLPAATQRTARENDINSLYKTVLGRDADPEGLKNYSSSSMSLNDVLSQISQSPENKKKQIGDLYKTILNREVDPEGLSQYSERDARAAGGFTSEELESISQDLRNSTEYKNRGLSARPTFKSSAEYDSGLQSGNFNSPERIGEARKTLGLGESDSPYLGLLAAANTDSDPNDFTQEEADYARELARRAQTSGDKRFAGQNLDQIYSVIDKANAADKNIFKDNEKELRSGQFLSGTGQTGFLLGDYLKSVGKTTSGGNQNTVSFYK
jgi:hypothetical protein